METLKVFFRHESIRRFSILLLITLLLISLRGMLDLMLLLFLITYVMNRLQQVITRSLGSLIKVNEKVVIIFLYVFLVTGLVVGVSSYLPIMVMEIRQLINEIIKFINNNQGNEIARHIAATLETMDVPTYAKQGLGYILKMSKWLEIGLLVIVLSLFFLLQKREIAAFTSQFKTSKISWFYNELEYFGKKFVSSFGKVIEAQLLIAVFNTVFTVIGIWILGFPYIFALGVMIFLLSLIPVAGVIISLVPLCIIAYQLGGVPLVVYVIIMIVVIHALESYFLNPKLMSAKTKLPMFYTFIVLIFSQHYFGIWGLIVGIPIFVFFLDILNVNKMRE